MSEERKKLTMLELRETAEFSRLTAKQKLFVENYVEGGLFDGNYDSIQATRIAYACKTPEIARVMSYSLMQNPKIIATLNRHFNAEPIDEFLYQVDRAIINKKLSVAQVEALKLKAILLGFSSPRLPGANHSATGIVPSPAKEAKNKKKEPASTPRVVRPTKPAEKSEYEREAEHF